MRIKIKGSNILSSVLYASAIFIILIYLPNINFDPANYLSNGRLFYRSCLKIIDIAFLYYIEFSFSSSINTSEHRATFRYARHAQDFNYSRVFPRDFATVYLNNCLLQSSQLFHGQFQTPHITFLTFTLKICKFQTIIAYRKKNYNINQVCKINKCLESRG